jgi:hypothetical protein
MRLLAVYVVFDRVLSGFVCLTLRESYTSLKTLIVVLCAFLFDDVVRIIFVCLSL